MRLEVVLMARLAIMRGEPYSTDILGPINFNCYPFQRCIVSRGSS